jgi:hypothetical protein
MLSLRVIPDSVVLPVDPASVYAFGHQAGMKSVGQHRINGNPTVANNSGADRRSETTLIALITQMALIK